MRKACVNVTQAFRFHAFSAYCLLANLSLRAKEDLDVKVIEIIASCPGVFWGAFGIS
jgi:hypothetical protein